MKSEEDIIQLIREDDWMLEILKAAKRLDLPDWWVCAGFVRSKVWDTLHGFKQRTEMPDVDVIYFDKSNLEENVEKELEEALRNILPDVPWSVKNEARMHVVNNIQPYTSSVDAISKFPETVTALGLKLDHNDNIILTAPHGVEDVINMEIRPTPHVLASKELTYIYQQRITKKSWQSTWTKVKVYN